MICGWICVLTPLQNAPTYCVTVTGVIAGFLVVATVVGAIIVWKRHRLRESLNTGSDTVPEGTFATFTKASTENLEMASSLQGSSSSDAGPINWDVAVLPVHPGQAELDRHEADGKREEDELSWDDGTVKSTQVTDWSPADKKSC